MRTDLRRARAALHASGPPYLVDTRFHYRRSSQVSIDLCQTKHYHGLTVWFRHRPFPCTGRLDRSSRLWPPSCKSGCFPELQHKHIWPTNRLPYVLAPNRERTAKPSLGGRRCPKGESTIISVRPDRTSQGSSYVACILYTPLLKLMHPPQSGRASPKASPSSYRSIRYGRLLWAVCHVRFCYQLGARSPFLPGSQDARMPGRSRVEGHNSIYPTNVVSPSFLASHHYAVKLGPPFPFPPFPHRRYQTA